MVSESIAVTPAIPVGSQPTGPVTRPPAQPEVSASPLSPKAPKETKEVGQSEVQRREEISKAIEDVQIMMELRNREVDFVRDEQAGTDVIKVVDTKSGDVIRQMPSEELLTFMRNLTKMLGALVDQRT